jgi:hypothetical protein
MRYLLEVKIMNQRPSADEESVCADLAEETQLICQAIEQALQKALKPFELEKRSLEPCVHAGLVRFHTACFLDDKGRDVEQDDDFEREHLTNNGLLLKSTKYWIRIRKAGENGESPVPGQSHTMQHFYNQEHFGMASLWSLLSNNNLSKCEQDKPLHLVAFWHITHRGRLISISLGCPMSGTVSTAEWYWVRRLPPLATLIIPATATPRPPDDTDDLDLGFRDSRLSGVEATP